VHFAVLRISLPGLITEFVSGIAGTVVVMTGTLAGCARAWAILRRFPPERVELITAAGVVFGAVAAILFVFIDVILELR
jgi:hypothetical protein